MIADTIEALSAMLAGIAGSTILTGQRELAEHGVPPRFVWVVLGAAGETGGDRNKTIGGKTTKELAIDAWRVACHCWGDDLRAAEKLRAAAITAIRKGLRGRRYQLRDTESPEVGWSTHGHLLVFVVEIHEPLLEVALPTLDAATYPTVKIESVAFNSSGATPGDGELTAGEG